MTGVSNLDAQLKAMRDAWQATARYRVIRMEPGTPDRTFATGLTWSEANARCEQETKLIEAEPGYRPHVMSRPLVHVELERAPEAPRACACGCARPVDGRTTLATPACRKRVQRRRDAGRAQASGPEHGGP